MKINEFLKLLEERQMISARVAQQVRDKVAKGDRKITSKSLLKYLVKKELITRSQAKQLLETSLTVTAAAESSILGMQALTPEKPVKKKKKPVETEEIPTLNPYVTADLPLGDEETSGAHADLASISSVGADRIPPKRKGDDGKGKKRQQKTKKDKKRGKKNEFDTPLLLFGGGGLLALILAGVIIGYLLTREDADAVLEEASGYFEGQSYTQAIKQYERFVENFTTHPEYSAAKVKLGLAKIWKATSSTSQYSIALKTAQEVLDSIEDETAFEQEAKKDLSTLLPKIADGLASQAERETDPDKIATLVEESKKALSLCANTKFIPTNLRNDVEINEIIETLDRVDREQEQRGSLQKALAEIQELIDVKDTAQAYAIHKQLLKDYPGLLDNESLAEKVRLISAAEQSVVQYVDESQPAETTEHPSMFLAELALSTQDGAPSGKAGVTAVRTAGAIFAIDTNSGKLLWRRYAGSGSNLPVLDLQNGDWLAIDADRHELMRLQSSDGKLVWRLPFESSIAAPVLFGERLLVTETSGKIHLLNATTGQRLGYVSFGQAIPVAPVVNMKKSLAYVVGEHSSLFTIRLDDFSCAGVQFVGHQRGSIAVPPVIALGKVALAENAGRDTARLHIFSTDNDGVISTEETSRRLQGLVNTPMLVDGRRLVALTSRGQISVYEIGSGTGKETLTKLAQKDSESGRAVARFGLLVDGHIWSAGKRLNKYSVLPTGKRLPPEDTEFDYVGDIFDYPPQNIDGIVVHLRHPKDRAGSTVAAMNAETGAALWETELGVPLAGPPAVSSNGPTISAVTASGAAYLLDRNAMRARVQDEAEKLSGAKPLPPLTESEDLGAGRIALGAPGQSSLLHFVPGRGLTEIQLPKPLACPLVAWGDAFVAPTEVGQVYLYDSATAAKIGSPFQPKLSSSESFSWLAPAVFNSADESLLVISDGKQNIYLLRRSSDPQPNIEAIAEASLGVPAFSTRLAMAGDTVFAGNRGGQLSRFTLPDLKPLESLDVGGSVVWGPYGVGEQILLGTGGGQMVSVSGEGEILWSRPLPFGMPVGEPLIDNDGVYVTWQKGNVSRVVLADGAEGEAIELTQPAVTGPVAFGNRLLLAAPDGSLLILDRP